MFHLFFGFSGRLRRREFILWSIIAPLVLIVPPAIGTAASAAQTHTTLAQDLAASGMIWPFVCLMAVSNYVSTALFWKRLNDVDEARQRKVWAGFCRWGYAVLTALTTVLIGLNLVALGEIDGTSAGIGLLALWSMACWLEPHIGPNSFGPDPRDRARADHAAMLEGPSASALNLDAAMQRALDERKNHATHVPSPKLARATGPTKPAPDSSPTFGRRKQGIAKL